MPRESWKEVLEPFAEVLDEQPGFREAMRRAHLTVERMLAGKSDTELRGLVRAAAHPTQTNCWYAIWEAAPIVRQVAKCALARRALFPEVSPKEARVEAALSSEAGEDEAASDVAKCRVCGCTDDEACEGGCFWVEDPEGLGDLCSKCLAELHEKFGAALRALNGGGQG